MEEMHKEGIIVGQDTWHWEGTLWVFIEIIQWAFVYHRLGKEQPKDWIDIITSPERVRAKAAEYGMTWRAIAREMVRCGNDAMGMLDILDACHTEGETAEPQDKN